MNAQKVVEEQGKSEPGAAEGAAGKKKNAPVKNTSASGTGEINTSKMTIEKLNTKLNESISELKTHLTTSLGAVKFETTSVQELCGKISELNLLGEFDRTFYSLLNEYFKNNGDDEKIMKDGLLNQVVYSQIINGKYNEPNWPSESQKKLIEKSLGKTGISGTISSALGLSKGGKKIIKNKRKYIRRKNVKK
jgi:aminopeptidase-like protein